METPRISRPGAVAILARGEQEPLPEAPMGRALKAVRSRDLEGLFAFFGVDARPELLEAYRTAIAARFTFEVQEIARLCRSLHERERHKLFREALRLAYQSSVGDGAELAR
jgi:hypothetical protein